MKKHPFSLTPILYMLWLAVFFSPHPFLLGQENDIQFSPLKAENKPANYQVFDIYQDLHGFMWFYSNFDDYLYKYDGQKFTSYPQTPNSAPSIAKIQVGELLADSWGREPDSLAYYDPYRDAFIGNFPVNTGSFSLSNERCFLKDTAGNIWMGTFAGLQIYTPRTKTFQKFAHRPDVSSSLSSNKVTSMLKDQQGRIWISTLDAGLNLWVSDSSFVHFQHQELDSNSLSSNRINDLEQDQQGFLWISTDRGLNRLDPGSREITRIELTAPTLTEASKRVKTIFITSSGKLWIGTHEKGILYFDPKTGQTQDFYEGRGLSSNYI